MNTHRGLRRDDYQTRKALNVAMIVGLIILILAFLGITVVSRSQVEGFLRVILPVLEWIKTLIES